MPSSYVFQVSCLGYGIVGLSLVLFVQAKDIYPQLLLARMFFAAGGAATATMVTAILPSMTAINLEKPEFNTTGIEEQNNDRPASSSVSSEVTITPARAQNSQGSKALSKSVSPTRLAGFVGAFAGCGALVALGLFLPLPTKFKNLSISDAQALKDTYYLVGVVAVAVAIFCFFGLRNLHGEEEKGWHSLWISQNDRTLNRQQKRRTLPYWGLIFESFKAGVTDYRIGLGYLGGFVARASSVGISLFIPLFVNHFFISSGLCKVDNDNPNAIKTQCKEAYILSAQLTGVSQLVALICAPIFGYLADKYRRLQAPLVVASLCGVIGYSAFASLDSPQAVGEHGSPIVFLIVSLLGISQIGAIVCSLGLIGRGIAGLDDFHSSPESPSDSTDTLVNRDTRREQAETDASEATQEDGEESGLLPPAENLNSSLEHIQGSIAGTYSLFGGGAILLLTKLGGHLFDSTSTASPFVMLAMFNAILCAGGLLCALVLSRKS